MKRRINNLKAERFAFLDIILVFDIRNKANSWWWWCYLTTFKGWRRGGTLRRPNSRATLQRLVQRSKMEAVVPKMARRRSSDAGQFRRRWVRSCIGKRTRKGCEVETVHSGLAGEGPVPPRKSKESGSRGSYEKDFVSTKSCNGRCQWSGNMRNGECCSSFGERVCLFISGKFSMTGDPLEA